MADQPNEGFVVLVSSDDKNLFDERRRLDVGAVADAEQFRQQVAEGCQLEANNIKLCTTRTSLRSGVI